MSSTDSLEDIGIGPRRLADHAHNIVLQPVANVLQPVANAIQPVAVNNAYVQPPSVQDIGAIQPSASSAPIVSAVPAQLETLANETDSVHTSTGAAKAVDKLVVNSFPKNSIYNLDILLDSDEGGVSAQESDESDAEFVPNSKKTYFIYIPCILQHIYCVSVSQKRLHVSSGSEEEGVSLSKPSTKAARKQSVGQATIQATSTPHMRPCRVKLHHVTTHVSSCDFIYRKVSRNILITLCNF